MEDVQHHPTREALLEINLWIDVVCPWCWIGEERLRLALDETGLTARTRITIRSFQLDPGAQRRPVTEMLAEKYGASPERVREMTGQVRALGAELGLDMDHDRAIACDTFDAHQLIHAARPTGRDVDVARRLYRAHFTDGADLSDHAVLMHVAGDVGLDEHAAEAALTTGAHAQTVMADIEEARRLGIRGVPFFVFAGRYAVSGAQPQEALVAAIERAIAPVV